MVIIKLRIQRIDAFLISLGDCAKASAGELVTLFLVHESVGGIAFEYDLEASCGFGIESIVEQHLRFVIGADVPAGESNGIVEVDGEFLNDSRVVVIWDFPLLGQLNFL